MTKEKIRERLKICHEQEDELNKQMGKLNATICTCRRKIKKLAKNVSKNMLYRNKLIGEL